MKNIFAIYKEKGPTSHDVIDNLRKITGVKKIGHAGTLDPLASGVLVVGIGREATKQLHKVVKKEKEYLACIKLGETSETDDEEGMKTKKKVKKVPNLKLIEKAANKFIGDISQIPPRFSAVKIKGQKAYIMARMDVKFKLKPRKVRIKKIKIKSYKWPHLKLKLTTGPGAYIRSLARDIGEELGCGGYLADLLRTRVGEYNIDKALAIEEFERLSKKEKRKK